MSGFYQMHRGWQDAEVFAGAEYSERDAWVWLIEAACWQPKTVRIKGTKVELQRGEMTFAQRFLADKWGWSKSRADRFLKRLVDAKMVEIRTKTAGQQRGNSGATNGATAGHPAGQGQSILTVCNYDKYQACADDKRGNDDAPGGATLERDLIEKRTKEEEGIRKKEKEERKRAQTRAVSDVPDWIPSEAWNGFSDMRQRTGHPLTPRAATLIFEKLKTFAEKGQPPGDVLDQSTMNGWRGIFELKGGNNGNTTRPMDNRTGATPVYRSNPALDRYRQLIGDFDQSTEADPGTPRLHN